MLGLDVPEAAAVGMTADCCAESLVGSHLAIEVVF
jgi:hypothetical protein